MITLSQQTTIDSMTWWTDSLKNRAPATIDLYTHYFAKFCDFTQTTPNALIDQQRRALANTEDDPRLNHVLENKVTGFIAHLNADGLSASTQRLAYAAVVSFFEKNQAPLRLDKDDRPRGEAVGSRIPETAEVRRLVDAARSRIYRAVVLALKDSGLRQSDLSKLRWRDVQDMGEGFWYLGERVTQKRGVTAHVFLGPESTSLLTELRGEPDDHIFPSRKSMKNALYKLIKATTIKGITAHGLRKFFKAQMQAARVNEPIINKFMGRKTSVYDENRVSQLFAEYKRGYPRLIVGRGSDLEGKVQNLEEEIRRLREHNLELTHRLDGAVQQLDVVQGLFVRFTQVIEDLERRPTQ